MESTITTKGQATIPKEIRDQFKLKAGDAVKWFIDPNGHIVVLPVTPVTALRGILKYSGPPISIEDMDPANFGRRRSRSNKPK